MLNTHIELREITTLKPWSQNARTHSRKQVIQLAQSIKEFGFTNPVLIDSESLILAGHGRVMAAQSLEMEQVPCICIDHMSADQKRAYVLADNKIALNAGWDEDLLAEELQALVDIDLEFDLELTGFTSAEIDFALETVVPEDKGEARSDQLPSKDQVKQRCSLGDVWSLGTHRLICGDALDGDTVDKLMDGHLATMVFTDPPYNVPIDGHVGGNGAIKHKEFAMASGEMTPKEFTEFLQSSFEQLVQYSVDGSIHFICMDWRHINELVSAGNAVYTELKNLIVWAKDKGGMGTFYRSRHELIFVFKNGTERHINTFELGQHGRYRTNVWEYRGVDTLRAGSLNELNMHPTVKPVQMIADAIRDVSKRGDIVLDLFGGSGSTLIAAHKTGRRAHLCELDPQYCDQIIARYEAWAHDEAICVNRAINEGEGEQ